MRDAGDQGASPEPGIGLRWETEQLADAAMSLVGCRTIEQVHKVIGDFMLALCPDVFVIVNEISADQEALVTRAVYGPGIGILAKGADLVGFDPVGREWAVRADRRSELLSGVLSMSPDGFVGLAELALPHKVAELTAEVLSLHDVYSIGIADGERILGNIQIYTRSPGVELPSYVIQSFARHCFTALDSIRRRIELETSEDKFRCLFDESPVAKSITRVSGEIEVNQAFLDLLGYTREEIAEQRTWRSLTHPDDVELTQAAITSLLDGDQDTASFEKRFVHKSGASVWVELTSRLHRDANGVPDFFITTIFDITERKRVAAQRAEREARLQALLDNAPSGAHIYELDADGRLVFAGFNRKAEEILGVDHSRLVGLTAEEAFPGNAGSDLLDEYRRVARDGGTWEAEQYAYDAAGIAGVFDVYAFSFGPNQVSVFFRDITERKKAETDLRESERWLGQSQRIAHLGHYIYDLVTDRWSGSDVLYTVLGVPEGHVCDFDGWLALVHPDDRERLANYFTEDVIGAHRPFDIEYRIVRMTDGAERWVHGLGEVERSEADVPLVMFGVIQDITESKLAEQRLLEGERRFRAAISASPVSMALVDADDNLVFLNSTFSRTFGYTTDDTPTLESWWEHAYPDPEYRAEVRGEWFAEVARSTRTGDMFEPIEATVTCRDGGTKTVLASSAMLGGSSGESLAILYDITERKEAQGDLQRSEAAVRERLRVILEPEGDVASLALSDVIDPEALQAMFDEFYRLTNVGIGIIDLEGNVLVGTGWQDICTEFHRLNPESLRNCIESDLALSQGVEQGQFKAYRCKNNLWDIVTPIEIAGQRIGNVFLGQFFYEDEVIDYDLFKAQARSFGFDEAGYIAALDRVPRWSKDKVEATIAFYANLATMISAAGYASVKLSRTLAQKEALLRERAQHVQQLGRSLNSIVEIVGRVAETRDPYTAGHQRRVAELSVCIAMGMGMMPAQVEEIRIAALLHDLGKLSVPAEILSKPGRLSEIEFELIRGHSESGYQIISSADMEGDIAELVHQHHERIDGSGYPRGLVGDEILPAARVIMVADVVEAMVSHRPYRAGLGLDVALSEIEHGAGVAYDPEVVAACVRAFREQGFEFSGN